jgi:hypothetical protein
MSASRRRFARSGQHAPLPPSVRSALPRRQICAEPPAGHQTFLISINQPNADVATADGLRSIAGPLPAAKPDWEAIHE